MAPSLLPSAHLDTFARDSLPPQDQWPDLIFTRPALRWPERLNAAHALLDGAIARGWGGRRCLVAADGTVWTYAELLERVNRIADVLVRDLGLVSGNRVLLRAPNTPMLAASWLAVLKAGGIAVTTMPLLRAIELEKIVTKAQVRLALCDARRCSSGSSTWSGRPRAWSSSWSAVRRASTPVRRPRTTWR